MFTHQMLPAERCAGVGVTQARSDLRRHCSHQTLHILSHQDLQATSMQLAGFQARPSDIGLRAASNGRLKAQVHRITCT